MKDIGEANDIPSIKIIKSDYGLILSQEHYVEKFLRKFEFYESKSISTLYDANTQLKKNRKHSVSETKYSQIIGSLMY